MKINIAAIVTGLALIGCQPDKKPNPTPVPVTPAPKAQSQVATPATKPQSQAAAIVPQSIATKAPDEASALAKSLLEGDQVAYSSSKNKIVYAETYQQEGTGAGLSLVFVDIDGKSGREDLEVYTPEDDTETKSTAMLPKIIDRLTKDGYTALSKTEWPEKQEKVSPFAGLDVSWKNNEIIAARAGEGPNTEKHKIKVEKPFKDRPLAVYASNTSPVFIVKIEHDPGDKYSEGFNIHTTYEVFPMPQVASK